MSDVHDGESVTEGPPPEKKPRPKRTLRQKVFRVLGSLVLLTILGAITGPVIFQNRMIYLARHYDPFFKRGVGDLKGFREYRTTDGRTQWGLFIPPAPLHAGETAKRPQVYLVFNGNGATAIDIMGVFMNLAAQTGIGFFLCDFRGYGYNDGRPTESGLVADAVGAYDTLESEGLFAGGSGIIGISLGGAAAISVASQRPAARLITLSTFTSMDAMAKRIVPWPIYLGCWNHWPNEERLKAMAGGPAEKRPARITLIHGTADTFVPYAMGERLAAVCGKTATFVPIAGCNHNDILGVAVNDVRAAIE